MLSVACKPFMMSVVMLNVIMLNVIMLSVVAPSIALLSVTGLIVIAPRIQVPYSQNFIFFVSYGDEDKLECLSLAKPFQLSAM